MSMRDILQKFQRGEISLEQTAGLLRKESVADLGHSKIDFDRRARTGFGEVVFGQGKTPAQIAEIFCEFQNRRANVLATRLSGEAREYLRARFEGVEIDEAARTAALYSAPREPKTGLVAVVSAGTSDMPVAREAQVAAEFFGCRAECFFDCGVAGLHRLLDNLEAIRKANAVIAIAGMEGALASVLAGLVSVPVVAVPTSVGYGANFGGLSALLSMINSCANGVSIVNIDNGFGAAYIAAVINKQINSRI